MIRTNIYLPQDIIQKLQRLAKEKKVSTSEVIRIFLQEKLEETKNAKNGAEVLLEMARNAKKSKGSGLGDLGQNHDYYLYGKGRKD